MSAPTEQRLVADKLYHRIMLADGRPCACVAGGGHQEPFSPAEFEAIRRRLVACWNACEGHTTEELEHHPSPIVSRLLNECDALRAELDALKQPGGLRHVSEFLDENAMNAVDQQRDEISCLLDAAGVPAGPISWRVREYRMHVERQRDDIQSNLTAARDALLREGMQRDALLEVLREADQDFEREGFGKESPYRAPIRAVTTPAPIHHTSAALVHEEPPALPEVREHDVLGDGRGDGMQSVPGRRDGRRRMTPLDYDAADDARAELAAQDRADRAHRIRLNAHPDCRDPDHPGCDRCDDDEEGGDE